MEQYYRHFKGNIYRILHTAKHSETLEDMVVYQAMYGDRDIWVRPKAMFEEMIERDIEKIETEITERTGIIENIEISGIIENINNKRKILGFDKGITEPNIIPMEKLDKFIDFCANINLENFAKKIRSTQTNISPDEIEFC